MATKKNTQAKKTTKKLKAPILTDGQKRIISEQIDWEGSLAAYVDWAGVPEEFRGTTLEPLFQAYIDASTALETALLKLGCMPWS